MIRAMCSVKSTEQRNSQERVNIGYVGLRRNSRLVKAKECNGMVMC